MNGGVSDDLPSSPVALVCFGRDEPSVFDQDRGRVIGGFLFSDGVGTEL